MKFSAILATFAALAISSVAANPVADPVNLSEAELTSLTKRSNYYCDVPPTGPAGCVASVGLLDCALSKTAAIKAGATAFILFPTSLHNGKGDAFFHCYWSALMVHRIGAIQAKTIGDLHEAKNNHPKAEKQMDLYNNAVGRQLGQKWKLDLSVKLACLHAVNHGQLKLIKY
ncbi:hypothetical protein HK104_009531 [Borealophlyctis nickersoniae]|nr:hypothetical protein HK104_009531 [Borealophlyctis nickersoniae]